MIIDGIHLANKDNKHKALVKIAFIFHPKPLKGLLHSCNYEHR